MFFMSRRQQSTGGKDVLTTTRPDGGKHAVLCQVVAQALHPLLVGGRQVNAWYLMEPYQVHAALYALRQLDDFTGMDQRVVQSAKADILERAAALVGKVILAQQLRHLLRAAASAWK